MPHEIVTVTLNPALDTRECVSSFDGSDKHALHVEAMSAGGKGVNVSRCLSLLGVPTRAVGIVGGATGKIFRRLVRTEQFPSRFVIIKKETRIHRTIRFSGGHATTHIVGDGPRVTRDDVARFEALYVRSLKRAAFISLSGRTANGASDRVYAKLIYWAHARNIPVVLDTSGKAFLKGLEARPEVIKPNREEAQIALGMRIKSVREIKKAVAVFHAMGVVTVLLSLGEQGLVGSRGETIVQVAPPKVVATNEVGCGDAVVAGFLYAQIVGLSFSRMIVFAAAAGTVNATQDLPGMVTYPQIARMMRRMTVQIL